MRRFARKLIDCFSQRFILWVAGGPVYGNTASNSASRFWKFSQPLFSRIFLRLGPFLGTAPHSLQHCSCRGSGGMGLRDLAPFSAGFQLVFAPLAFDPRVHSERLLLCRLFGGYPNAALAGRQRVETLALGTMVVGNALRDCPRELLDRRRDISLRSLMCLLTTY